MPLRDSDGKAGAVIFTDSTYEIAVAKSNAMADVIKACGEQQGAGDRRHAAGRRLQPHAAAHHLAAAALRHGLDHMRSSINDLTFDFMAPSLAAAGIAGTDNPQQHLRRRRQRGRLPAHPQRRIPGGDGGRAAAAAGLADRRRGQPRARQGEGQRLRRPAALFLPTNIEHRRRRRRTSTTPRTAITDAYLKIWGVDS